MVTAQCEFCLRRYLKAAMGMHLQVSSAALDDGSKESKVSACLKEFSPPSYPSKYGSWFSENELRQI